METLKEHCEIPAPQPYHDDATTAASALPLSDGQRQAIARRVETVFTRDTSAQYASPLPQTTQGGFTPMPHNLTVEQQIALFKEMGRHIWQLKTALEEASNQYDRQIKGMEGRGMDDTVSQFYEVHVIPLLNHLQLAEDGLTDEALPSLQRIIQHLEDLPRI